MQQHDLESSVSDWVIDHPEALPVFEMHGVDYTCGGKSLAHACRQRGLDPAWFFGEVLKVLRDQTPPSV